MELSTVLVAQLRELSASMGDSEWPLTDSVTAVTDSMREAVPSYRGLTLTILRDGYPVTLNVFENDHDEDIVTSLRVPLDLFSVSYEVGSRIDYYAAVPGAFVDLAADLSYALTPPPSRLEPLGAIATQPADGSPTVELDTDLPAPSQVSSVAGLAAISVINQAVGVLIGRGHHPDHAHGDLRSHAAAAGLDPHSYALELLANTTGESRRDP